MHSIIKKLQHCHEHFDKLIMTQWRIDIGHRCHKRKCGRQVSQLFYKNIISTQ